MIHSPYICIYVYIMEIQPPVDLTNSRCSNKPRNGWDSHFRNPLWKSKSGHGPGGYLNALPTPWIEHSSTMEHIWSLTNPHKAANRSWPKQLGNFYGLLDVSGRSHTLYHQTFCGASPTCIASWRAQKPSKPYIIPYVMYIQYIYIYIATYDYYSIFWV